MYEHVCTWFCMFVIFYDEYSDLYEQFATLHRNGVDSLCIHIFHGDVGCMYVQATNGIHLRKVKKVVVVPLLRNGRPLSDSRQKDEDRYLQLLHMYTHFDFISVYNHLVCI